ncbi:unnamed protein product, partial [Clonostachys byssicola]
MENRSSVARLQPDSSGLQAVLDPTLEVTPGDGMILVSSEGLAKPEEQSQSATLVPTEENISEAQKKPRRRRYYIIGAVAAALIILGAVLGGVLGSRKKAQTEVYSMTTAEQVPSHSRLAFSSWHDSTGFVRHIFYQEANGTLQSCMSRGVSPDLESIERTPWGRETNLSPDYRAQNMSGLATGLTIQDSNGNGNGKALQVEAFYLNTTNFVNGIVYGRSFQYIGDSINYKDYQALEGSSLAAYWPYVLFQSRVGQLQISKYASGWTTQMSSIRARHRSVIAVVPTSRNYTEVSTAGRIAVFYASSNNLLSVWEDPLGMGQGTKFANQTAWNSSFPKILLYPSSSLAALAVAASSDDADSKIHTFVLYQDQDSKIQQLRREGAGNDWQMSTPGAFNNADNLTSIACVTGPTWINGFTPDDKPNEVTDPDRLLEPASNLTRCVFLSGGHLMETRLDGVDWAPPTPVDC